MRVVKQRMVRWVGHVARLVERRGFWWGNLMERYHLEYPAVRWKYNIKMGIKEVGRGG
jgi:hypothetical protein